MRHAQKRISDLLHKADAVDKAEHDRVTAALKAAQEQLAQAQAEVEQLRPLQASVNKLTGDVQAMRSNLSSVQVKIATHSQGLQTRSCGYYYQLSYCCLRLSPACVPSVIGISTCCAG